MSESFRVAVRRSVVFAAVVGGSVAVCPAGAGILTYTSQTRAVSASTTADANSSQTMSAPGFGPFDAAASASSFSAASSGTMSANTEQHSRLYPQTVGMTGRVSAVDGVPNGFAGTASSASTLNTAFTLDVTSPYTFNLTTAVSGISGTSYQYLLTGSGGTVFTGSGDFQTPVAPLSGTLLAGSYTLAVQFSAQVGTPGVFTGAGTYNAVFAVPEPATAAFCGLVGLALRRRRRARG